MEDLGFVQSYSSFELLADACRFLFISGCDTANPHTINNLVLTCCFPSPNREREGGLIGLGGSRRRGS